MCKFPYILSFCIRQKEQKSIGITFVNLVPVINIQELNNKMHFT